MGADLLIAGMAAPHQDGVKPWQIDPARAEQIGHERIAAYDFATWTDDLDAIAMNLGIRTWDDDAADAAEPEAARAALIADVRAALDMALTELFGYRRDVATLGFGGRDYWLSGGMSGGDAPTDAYEWIAALDLIRVYEEPLPATDSTAEGPAPAGEE